MRNVKKIAKLILSQYYNVRHIYIEDVFGDFDNKTKTSFKKCNDIVERIVDNIKIEYERGDPQVGVEAGWQPAEQSDPFHLTIEFGNKVDIDKVLKEIKDNIFEWIGIDAYVNKSIEGFKDGKFYPDITKFDKKGKNKVEIEMIFEAK